VVEVIDYDFGPNQRRGILRNIPDVDADATRIVVTSPDAPADLQITQGFGEVRLRVGNPSITISNRHRYRIEYGIETVVRGDQVAWDAVGTDWTVGVNNAHIDLVADRELSDLRCDRGGAGAIGGCDLELVAPGHARASVSGLGANEGVTVWATLGGPLTQVPVPAPLPSGPADDPGSPYWIPALFAAGGAVLAAGVASRVIRRLGREQVWEGGPADAAFGPPSGQIAGVELIDHARLAEMATIEFESPRGLSAAAGGIIHDEAVRSEHQIAWLIECAIREEVELEEADGKEMSLRRGPADPHPAVAHHLQALFGGRDEVTLGKYSKRFATAWEAVGRELDEWRKGSGLWDPAGARRRRLALAWGWVGVLLGLAGAVLGGIFAGRAGSGWLWVAVVGGLVAGGGAAAVIRSWELPVRTPEGSARWLQIESFRRFIENSEARHAEAAAGMGVLRQYTAWAVALGELDHWRRSVEAAAADPASGVSMSAADFAFVTMAPRVSSATAQTFTAPSSSGGGGGGGVGGGGGGGGGGSW
ncbi:MAG: DUF2207 domain-containing protein, partial [Actinomycetota bacterium]